VKYHKKDICNEYSFIFFNYGYTDKIERKIICNKLLELTY